MFYSQSRRTTVCPLLVYFLVHGQMYSRRSVENDATSVFSMARVLDVRCSSQRVILLPLSLVCFPSFSVSVACSTAYNSPPLISALGMCFPLCNYYVRLLIFLLAPKPRMPNYQLRYGVYPILPEYAVSEL